MSGDPRIPMLSLEEAKKAASAVDIPEPMAELSIFRVLLRNPPLAKQVNELLLTLIFRGKLDARLRELVIMRLGWRTASMYEWTQHWRVARNLGVPEEDLLAVRDWQASPRFSDGDRAVLQATDDILEHGVISAETWLRCTRHAGGVEALLELVAAIGTWRMISSLLRSLEIPLEPGVDPWPPDGASPTASAPGSGEAARDPSRPARA
jgi:alkylhydroperoxidase family enzyme